ncbi:helix-turn-helix domain-containing protein [Paenibacillus qinlingensis]|uniref:helix-turn-helix domain-containing protein n=1 Tax=Paenibacillus qinlingensis TaxID=1837343 RepID=UPI00156428E0|nr:helix-turn-helix domain-containing protein [Paenibacillus qinlingensis]NQX64179.1 AraC family transcriptional regulator [Paenibacillus qinlingensis]
MFIQRYSPSLILRPYIEAIMVQDDFNAVNFSNRNSVKVLPSTMTVIGIQYGQPMKLLENHKSIPMSSSGITGMHATVKEYLGTGAIGTVIISFKPGGLSHFTRYPIHEFQNADVSLDLVFPPKDVREMEEKLAEASSATERVDIVQQFLLSALRDNVDELLIQTAAQAIIRHQGSLSIERLAAQLYVSKRTLERRFNTLIGTSPKQFAGIVRFQQTIRLHYAGYDYLDIVQACGYTDHAHLSKDFKSFAGTSPEQFFRSEVQPELKRSLHDNEPLSGPSEHLYY